MTRPRLFFLLVACAAFLLGTCVEDTAAWGTPAPPPAPSESECRPYIEKALKEMEHADATGSQEEAATGDQDGESEGLEQADDSGEQVESEQADGDSAEEGEKTTTDEDSKEDTDAVTTSEGLEGDDSHEEQGEQDEDSKEEGESTTAEDSSSKEEEEAAAGESVEEEQGEDKSGEEEQGDDKSGEEEQGENKSEEEEGEVQDGEKSAEDQGDDGASVEQDKSDEATEEADSKEEGGAEDEASVEAAVSAESQEQLEEAAEDGKSDEDNKSEEAKADEDNSGEDKADENKSGEDKDDEDKSGEDKSGEDKDDEDKSGEDKADEAKSEEDKTDEDKSGEDRSGEDKSGEDKADTVKSDEDNTAEANSEEEKSDDTKSEEDKTDEAKSEEDKTDEAKSGEDKSGEDNTDEAKSGEDKSGEDKSGEDKSGEDTADEAKSGEEEDGKSGEDKSGEDKSGEEEDGEADDSKELPEEDLTMEIEIPDNLRPRDHIAHILKLDDESAETETIMEKAIETTLRELKRLYDTAIKPLEMLYKYRDLSNRHFGDPEIFSKPLILFMGPWSGGKSTIINYLLDNEYTQYSLRTGAEPSPAYFNILMHGERGEILDGTQLAADWTFSGLQKFGQGLLDRLRGVKLNNPLLEKVNIVEIPGILEIRKQVERMFPFNDACQWFIDRADIIFLVYDPSKLDVGPETEAILDQLKGREYQTRIILNKADQVRPEELMRVQGTLIWNISPLMSSAEPPIMYSTSLWSMPYESGAPVRLLQAQEFAFLRDLREAVNKRVDSKIASARRFAVRVRNHAKMVDCYLTTYYNHKSFFGNKKKTADDIIEHPQEYHIYEGLSTLTNISRYDLPDPETYRDFFKLNPLFEFQQLSATCTYFRGCPINRLDIAIAYDLPELVGKYKKSVEEALEQHQKAQPKS